VAEIFSIALHLNWFGVWCPHQWVSLFISINFEFLKSGFEFSDGVESSAPKHPSSKA
jgi:hypothetical protein